MGTSSDSKQHGHFLAHHFRLVVARYFMLLIPVVLLTLSLHTHQEVIKGYSIAGLPYLDFLLVIGLVSPCLAQFVLFTQLESANNVTGSHRKRSILISFFDTLPTVVMSSVIFSTLVAILLSHILGLQPLAATSMYLLLVMNCLFAAFVGLLDRLKMRLEWFGAWTIYVAGFYLKPLWWWFPATCAVIFALLMVWPVRSKLGNIDYKRIITFSGLRGLFLASVIWMDKIVLYLSNPKMFNAEYVFISLIPCVLTLNFYYVFIQRKLEKAINSLVWGINNYTIAQYIESNRDAILILKKSFISISFFAIAAHATTFIGATFILSNTSLLFTKMMMGLAVTMMVVILNIHLYFTANMVFFLASFLFIFAANWVVMVSPLYFAAKLVIAIFLLIVAFQIITRDLVKRWKSPHRYILGFE